MDMEAERRSSGAATPEITHEQEALAKAAGAWVVQFARTLKNCRLYDARNPNVARFREQLGVALGRLLEEHGSVTLRFTSDDVLCEGVSLYPAKSRDDNVALPFYRDGVRAVTLAPGVTPSELDALVDAVLATTGQNDAQDDLVTLLWQAHLQNIEVDFVPAEGDAGAGSGAEGQLSPWPASGVEPGASGDSGPAGTPAAGSADAGAPAAGSADASATATEAREGRSDDWNVGECSEEIEAGFAELDAIGPVEKVRFQGEFEAEHAVPTVATAIAIARAFAGAEAQPADLVELARFLPRVLRIAMEEGRWREAREAFGMLGTYAGGEWAADTFVQELQQPISIATAKRWLEEQDLEAAADFVALARELGEPGVELLHQVLTELDAPPQQAVLSAAIVEACRTNPERLAPWLADRRPAVVRIVVAMLGAIGGDAIVGVLVPVLRHEEACVRQSALEALKTASLKVAHPLLLGLLQDKEPRIFCGSLQRLSEARDPGVARRILGLMLEAEFVERPAEEKRAIYAALGSTGGDEVVPELEAELLKGTWFSRADEGHRQAVARCLWRVGTARARLALENGAHSKRAPLRALCEQMLARWGQHG
jgi:HEAT repeat protein